MPKYFQGAKILPGEVVILKHESVDKETLDGHLEGKTGDTVFSVRLPGLPETSLGYVFFVESQNNLHIVKDIKGIIYFSGICTDYLARIIKHASGIEFDSEIQSEFYRTRNERGIDQ